MTTIIVSFASFLVVARVGTSDRIPETQRFFHDLTVRAKSLSSGVLVIERGGDPRAETELGRGGADRVVSPCLMAAVRPRNEPSVHGLENACAGAV